MLTSTRASATLAAAFDVVRSKLPAALVAPPIQTELQRLAGMLAPLPRAGFEVRLGACPDVDVQQWLTASGDEPRRLREHLSRQGWDSPATRGLERFLSDWGDPTHHLHDEIGELWLEFDRGAAGPPDELPPLSLFAGLNDIGGRDGLELAASFLDAVAPAERPALWMANLERCFAGCPKGAFVSHIGLMLERPVSFLRVNVKRLEPDALPSYLHQVGWRGPLDEAVRAMSRIRPLVDGVTTCLDVGSQVSGRLGLECTIEGQPPSNPRWAGFLDTLVEWDLCTGAKRDALLQWPGVTTPLDTDAPWPAPLIRAELLRGADHFTAFERRLSHVKITLGSRGCPDAKAYFGFFHAWLRPGLDSEEARPAKVVAPEALAPRRVGHPPATAIARAVAFLLASRSRSGWWRDFSGVLENGLTWRAGCSDEWVTAFVATALASLPERSAQQAAREAWDLLRRRRPPGAGWGYNRLTPGDADSTAWGLRLAEAVGERLSPHAIAGRDALARHVIADGGLTTYTLDAFDRPPSTRTSREDAYGGWACTSHACVTAVAARAIADDRPLDFLRRSQRSDGSWSGYWWADPEYTTALASEALAATGRAADAQRVQAAGAWGLGRLASDGSVRQAPFATAWCVRLLALADNASTGAPAAREYRRRATAWLRDQQREDGSWESSARLLVHQPQTRDPAHSDLPPTRTFDDARVFTTAAVLSALGTDQP
jgi:Prenyltransferase and squalene oxidase repeat